jgi:hypothetical protein
MTQKRFARLTNGFSKKLTHHAAAVSLYVTHYNLCRVHEALRTTPGVALGLVDKVWAIGDLLDACDQNPSVASPDRRFDDHLTNCAALAVIYAPFGAEELRLSQVLRMTPLPDFLPSGRNLRDHGINVSMPSDDAIRGRVASIVGGVGIQNRPQTLH